MAYFYGPAQISIDPENTGSIYQAAAAAMMLPGTRITKAGRTYLYVLVDSGATVPSVGGLMYMLTLATWGQGTQYKCTNGANGLTTAANYSIGVGFENIVALTAGDYGFLQIRGDSLNKISTAIANVGSLAVTNLTNAANPERAILATTTNIVLTNQVAIITAAASSNLAPALIDVQGV